MLQSYGVQYNRGTGFAGIPSSGSDQAFSGHTGQQQYHGVDYNGSGSNGGSVQQQQQQMQPGQPYKYQQPLPYTSGPYQQHSVPVPAQAQPPVRQGASPQQHLSPHAAGTPAPHQPEHQNQNSPVKYPMAAPPPPLPQTPSSHQQPSNSDAVPSPGTPLSPGAQSKDQQRIDLLFEINVELLQEVNRLQNEGEGGAISAQQVEQLNRQGKPATMASDKYIHCLRRVQANLAYLMPKAQPDPATQQKAPPGPAHMTPPPHMSQLQEKYERLRELFPDWHGLDHRMPASSSSPNPQQTYGNGTGPPALPTTN